MNRKILLRIAAFLMLFHALGHTMGAISWDKASTPAAGLVIKGMQAAHFNFMGRYTTIASFYEGYGIIMIFVWLLVTVVLWLLSNEAQNKLTVRLIIPLAIFLLLTAVAEFIYFFPFAAVISLLACIAVLLAWMPARKNTIV